VDTLKHIKSPKGYFNFITKHISLNGVGLAKFPNKSEKTLRCLVI